MLQYAQIPLQRLNEAPESLPPHEYRFYVLSNYAFLVAAVFHFCFIFLMAILGVYPLAIYNIFSSLIWGLAIYLNMHGFKLIPYILSALEVLVHAWLTSVFVGWIAGFHYYILAVPIVVFLSYFSMPIKLAFALGNCLGYLFLSFLSHQIKPTHDVGLIVIQALNYGNIIGISFCISFFAYYYRHNVLKMETKLAAEHQRTVQALEDRNQALRQINADLADAADYVRKALPPPIRKGPVRSDWSYIPSASLGGDAFGYHWLDGHHFGIYLLDVSGHGVGAALLSVTVMNVLRTQALPDTDFRQPEEVLTALNRAFQAEENNDMFFTIWYGVYNRHTRDLVYASGGHPPALLINHRNKTPSGIQTLRTKNHIVGGLRGVAYQQMSHRLRDPSSLYVFSDGVYEFRQKDDRMWQFQNFVEFLTEMRQQGEEDIESLVTSVQSRLQSNDFDDDVTILKLSFA